MNIIIINKGDEGLILFIVNYISPQKTDCDISVLVARPRDKDVSSDGCVMWNLFLRK
jgi:polysaccharide pyruvyl transferase WcaK-like protein